jgi:transcriptional coactivator p15 (PC4)
MNSKKVLHKFPKNANEEVRVEISRFHQYEIIDIRAYFRPDSDPDKWLPSRKGIALRTILIPDLKKGIDLALKALKKK